jgi:hypothetical protein
MGGVSNEAELGAKEIDENLLGDLGELRVV